MKSIRIELNGQKYSLINGGRPPKMRFKIGDKFKIDNDVWTIFAAFRVKTEPHEWLYYLESSLRDVSEQTQCIDAICAVISTDKEPSSRIMYDMFHSSMDAMSYFRHIPIRGSGRMVRKNSQLISCTKIESEVK